MVASNVNAERISRAFKTFPSFCGLLQVQPKEGDGRIPFILTPLQIQYNRARTNRDNLLKGRQVYVTSLECARDLWWFLTRLGAHVVIVVQSQTDMVALKDVSDKITLYISCLRALGVNLKFGVESATAWSLPERDATLRVIQSGASRMAAQKKGRGGTVNRLHFTEMAFWEQGGATFNSLMESVSKHGSEVVNESTPNGAAGFYYEQWMAATTGQSSFTNHFLKWWEHPEYREIIVPEERFAVSSKVEELLVANGATLENLKWRREKIREKGGNELLVNQEYPNDVNSCFLLSGRTFFDQAMVEEALSLCGAPIAIDAKGALRIWEQPKPNGRYVIGADTSEGGGGDPSAAIVFDADTQDHVATVHGQLIPEEYAKLLAWLARKYNGALVAVERNNHGNAVLLALISMFEYRNVYAHSDKKHGWPTNEATRTPMLDALDAAFRRGSFRPRDRRLAAEMRTMTVINRGVTQRAEAADGSHDDLVMAAAIGWAVMMRPIKRVFAQDE